MENNTIKNSSCVENGNGIVSSLALGDLTKYVRVSIVLVVVAYFVYHLTKLIIKYKDRLEPVHMFEINTLMDIFMATSCEPMALGKG